MGGMLVRYSFNRFFPFYSKMCEMFMQLVMIIGFGDHYRNWKISSFLIFRIKVDFKVT